MHRKEKYQVLSVRLRILVVLLFLAQRTGAVHNKAPHSSSDRTKFHTSDHHRSSVSRPGTSSETSHTKRSDVKRPLSKIDGNVYTVANIEQLNTVHSVLVNPAFSTHKNTITQGTSRVTPIQAKSLISQNSDSLKKEKLLAHVTNDASEDFEDAGKTFYGSKKNPAKSCRDVFLSKPAMPSGNYWIKTADGELLLVTCGFPNRNVAELQESDDINGQTVKALAGGPFMKEFKRTKTSDEGDEIRSIKHDNGDDEFQFVKIENSKHDVVKPKLSTTDMVQRSYEGDKKGQPSVTVAPRRTPTKDLKMFSNVQLVATLVPKPQPNGREFVGKPYRVVPTTKIKKQTTNHKVVRSPTEKPFTTHDPTSLFEAMESALHPTHAGRHTLFPVSPTRKRTTSPKTRSSTKPVYSVNKHAIETSPRVNSKLLRVREEDITDAERPEVGTRSDPHRIPADAQHDSPKFKNNNEGTGEAPKHNFQNGDRAQKVENVNKQIQQIVESQRNANDTAMITKSKDNAKTKKDDNASKAESSSNEEKSVKMKSGDEGLMEPGKALPTKASSTKPLPKLAEEADAQFNTTHNKELLKNSEELLKNSKEILKNSKKILENSKEPLKSSKELLENSKEILKFSKNSTDAENPKKDVTKEEKEKKESEDSTKQDSPVVGLLPIPGAAGSPLVGGSPLIGGLPLGNGLQLGVAAPLVGGLPAGIGPVSSGVPLGGGTVPDATSQLGLLQNPVVNNAYGGLPMMPSPVGGMMVNPGMNPLQSGIDGGGTQHILVPEVTVSLTGNGKGGSSGPAMSPKVEAWNGNAAGAGDLGDIQDEERPLPKLQPIDEIYGRKNNVPVTKSSGAQSPSEAPEEIKSLLPETKSSGPQSQSEAPREVKNSLTASLSLEQVDENAQVRSWQSHEKAMRDKHDFDKQYKNFTSLDTDNLMPHLKENQENARTRSWSAREFEMQKQQIQQQYDEFEKEDPPKKSKSKDFNTDFGKAFEEFERQRKLTMENITKSKEEKKHEADKEEEKHQGEKEHKEEMDDESDNEYQEYLKLLEANAPSREEDKKYEGYVKAVESDNESEPASPINSTLIGEKPLKNISNIAQSPGEKGGDVSSSTSTNVEKTSLQSSENTISDSFPTNSSAPKQNTDISSSSVVNDTTMLEPATASLVDKKPNVELHPPVADAKPNGEPPPAPAGTVTNEKPIPVSAPSPSGNEKPHSGESIAPKASDKPNVQESSAIVVDEKPKPELTFAPRAKLDDSSLQAIKTGVDKLMPLLNSSIPLTEKKADDASNARLSTNSSININRLVQHEEGGMKKSNGSAVSANKRHELRPNRNYKIRTEEDTTSNEGKSTVGAESASVEKPMNPPESLLAEPETEGGFDKRVETPTEVDHIDGSSEHVINNIVKIEEEEQARKRADNDKYDLYKRLQHGLKTDENSKPPNIYVDNRVFIYDGDKSKTDQPYVRGKPGKTSGKGVSAKTYIIDREMKVSNDPKLGRVIITTKEPVKKTLNVKEAEDKVIQGSVVPHEEEQVKDVVNEEAEFEKNNEDTSKIDEDSGGDTKNVSASEVLSETNSTNNLPEALTRTETILEGEKKEAAIEVKRKPKLITLPAPHNFIIPETKKFSNAMKNLSALENLAQKETPSNLVRDVVSAKGKPTNFDSYGEDTVTKSKILPYSGARYHMANAETVRAATYVNDIDDMSRGANIATSATYAQKKNRLSKEQKSAVRAIGNNKEDSRAEGTPILIYFTRDKNANVPAIAQTHDGSSTPSPSKILKNVNKFVKLEKSIIKSMNEKSTQTPILPQFTPNVQTESTARNFTSEPEPVPMFKSNVKSEIKTVSSVTTKAQVDCCSTVTKKSAGNETPPVKVVANLTIEEVPGVGKNTITGESKYTSPINQENLPGANAVDGGDEVSNAAGDPVTIDMQGIHNPITQMASGMQDMIAQAQSSMGNVPGLTNKTKNSESGNGTNDGSSQAREVIPHEPVADNAEKIQDVPKQINAEKLPFVEKRFQIPTKIFKHRLCEEKPIKISHSRKRSFKKSCVQSASIIKNKIPHNYSTSHKMIRRDNKEDDLMMFYKTSGQPQENERDDTNSPFASINNPELLEDLVDASRNADISQMRNFHVPTAESIITMPELHVLNLINRSLNTVFNIQTSQLGGTRINNDTRYPITKKQIIKIIKSIEKLHSPKVDENSPTLNYKKISQMAFSTFQKFLARHNASASLLQGDEFPKGKSKSKYGEGIASERSREVISEKRLQFGGSRSRKFRQMLLDDTFPNVEKRSSLLINGEKEMTKKGKILKNNSNSEHQKTKRELIPSRVGALQPSNLKPLPPVGHDPDEEPFQAIPDALETPTVIHNSTKQQQKQQHNAENTNEEKVDETLAEKNREALKSYEEQRAKEERKESTMDNGGQGEQALKNNPSGSVGKTQTMTSGADKPQPMAIGDISLPFRFNWTKLEEEKFLQLQKQLAAAQNISSLSQDPHGPSQQVKQQQNLTGPVEAPAGLNLPSSTASLQNEKQGINSTSQHQYDDDHEVQNSPHNNNNNNNNNNNKNNNNSNNNAGGTYQTEHPFEAKMNNSLIASMEERKRNESIDANKNKVLHESDPVIHENDKQYEREGEGSHAGEESQHHNGNPYKNKAELDKNKNLNGQEAQPEQSPPVGEDGKPHADSGPQEHKIIEAKAKAPLEPPSNASAPDVGETDKGEIGSSGVTSVAKKLKPVQTKPDKTYQDNDIDTTFEAGLREEEKKAKASKMKNNAHQKILSSSNNNNNNSNKNGNNNNSNSSNDNIISNNNSNNNNNNNNNYHDGSKMTNMNKESTEVKSDNSPKESASEGEQTISSDGSKVFHQTRKISFNPENKTQPSSMLITSDASYGPRQNQTKLQIDINPRNSANESLASAKAEAKEREIKEMKESLEDLVKQQHTNYKYPHLKLPTKNGDYIGPLDIFDDLGSQPTSSTTSAAAVKSKGSFEDNAIMEERKAGNDAGIRLQPTRSTQTTTRKQPKIGKINHNYDDDEEFQNIIDSTPTESGGKKTTQALKQKTTPVLPSKIKEETKKMKENPTTMMDNRAENGGLNWTMVQELLKKEAQAKEASKANKNEGDNGEYVPLLANTSDGKSIPLIPIPMDSPLGKLLYPALGQKDGETTPTQQTKSNVNSIAPNLPSNDEVDLSSLLLESPTKPFNKRGGGNQNLQSALINKLLQDAKAKAQYTENPLEIAKSQQNKKEVVLLPDKRGLIIAKSNYLSDLGKPMKNTFSISSRLNSFKDKVAEVIPKLTTSNYFNDNNNNNNNVVHQDENNNDGQIHITVQKKNGQLLLIPDQKEALERQMVPQSIKLDLQYKVTQLQKKDQIHPPFTYQTKTFENNDISLRDYSIQKKDLIFSHRKSRSMHRRRRRKNVDRFSGRKHSRGWKVGEKT